MENQEKIEQEQIFDELKLNLQNPEKKLRTIDQMGVFGCHPEEPLSQKVFEKLFDIPLTDLETKKAVFKAIGLNSVAFLFKAEVDQELSEIEKERCERVSQYLLENVRTSELTVQIEALKYLGRLGRANFRQEEIRTLSQDLFHNPEIDPLVRNASVDVLVELPEPNLEELLPNLIERVQSSQGYDLHKAIEGLGAIGDESHLPLVENILQNGPPNAHEYTKRAISKIKSRLEKNPQS